MDYNFQSPDSNPFAIPQTEQLPDIVPVEMPPAELIEVNPQEYFPGAFPIATLDNTGRATQIEGVDDWRVFSNNENAFNVNRAISGRSALMALFGNTDGTRAQGAFYDIQRLDTLYQDTAGLVPVTALEQSVARVNDISGNGNHATQATAGSRPVLSAKYNFNAKSENFSDAAWLKITCSVSSNNVMLVDSGQPNGYIINQINFLTGQGYTQTLRIRPVGRTTVDFVAQSNIFSDVIARTATYSLVGAGAVTGTGGGGVTASITYLGAGEYLLAMSFTATATVSSGVQIRDNLAGDGSTGFLLRYSDIRFTTDILPNIPAYQRVNTSTDYDYAGFPKYLKFDGVDDRLTTPAIDFTGGDTVVIVAGVTKLVDGAVAVIAESSIDSGATVGAFGLLASVAGGANFGMRSNGTVLGVNQQTIIAAPTSKVITGYAKIATPVVNIGQNGVFEAENATNQGAGNYTSQQLAIGGRIGGTALFNGRIFGLAVSAKQTGTLERFNASEEMGAKMGQVF